LKNVIEEAKSRNMPLATINSTIKKFSSQQTLQLKRYFMEMKFLSKIFVISEFYTENLINLKSSLNIVYRKEPKSAIANVKHFFDEHGIIQVALPEKHDVKNSSEFEEKLTEDAIECEAQEVVEINFETKSALVICDPEHIERVKTSFLKLDYVLENSQHVFIPQNTIELSADERKLYDSFLKRLTQIEGFENFFDNVEAV
jgi:transcriptional/translational regulatory protein YebC/TACO1